ncbi:peptidoglycan-binding protein, partial [Janthinobacterium aquaticum]|uniref:peptidoglycan-binding protein n=1 Tax=Janthinobacterium sp. FT58W TaxID=2654254 RepID=UPI00139ACBD2
AAAPAPGPAEPAPAATPDRDSMLRQLAALWGEQIGEGDVCQAAARAGLRCLHSRGGVAEVRVLDRPALLTLHDAAGKPQSALLSKVEGEQAHIVIDGKPLSLPLGELAQRSDSDFTTFWRAPRHWRDEVPLGARGADVDWLATHLAQWRGVPLPAVNAPFDAAMQRTLLQFQQSQHLKADGLAGPKTFMRLMLMDNNTEPRLSAPASLVAGK